MKTCTDDIRRLMEELADEGQATANADEAAAEIEQRARNRVPEAWEHFTRVVVVDERRSK